MLHVLSSFLHLCPKDGNTDVRDLTPPTEEYEKAVRQGRSIPMAAYDVEG